MAPGCLLSGEDRNFISARSNQPRFWRAYPANLPGLLLNFNYCTSPACGWSVIRHKFGSDEYRTCWERHSNSAKSFVEILGQPLGWCRWRTPS